MTLIIFIEKNKYTNTLVVVCTHQYVFYFHNKYDIFKNIIIII